MRNRLYSFLYHFSLIPIIWMSLNYLAIGTHTADYFFSSNSPKEENINREGTSSYQIPHSDIISILNEVQTGNPEAYFNLALVQLSGEGMKDEEIASKEACSLLSEAASFGHPQAQGLLEDVEGNLHYHPFPLSFSFPKINPPSSSTEDFFQLAEDNSNKSNNEVALPNLEKFNCDDIYAKQQAPTSIIQQTLQYFNEAKNGNQQALIELIILSNINDGKFADEKLYQLSQELINNASLQQMYNKLLKHYINLAREGDKETHFMLGELYDLGFEYFKQKEGGRIEHYDNLAHIKAKEQYELAASKGHTLSYKKLGDLYQWGRGVKTDIDEAIKYYDLGAVQNEGNALIELARIYRFGEEGVEKDYSTAMRYIERAIELEHPIAYIFKGQMFEDGEGVELNLNTALRFYRLAADKFNGDAQKIIGDLYAKTGEHELARQWYQLSTQQEIAEAYRGLGDLERIADNLDKAQDYYHSATQESNHTIFGRAFKNEREGNYKEAIYWYNLAADNNDLSSLHALIRIYQSGYGGYFNNELAFNYAKIAADQNDAFAQFELGKAYLKGLGVQKDYKKAYEYFLSADKQGFDQAKDMRTLMQDLEWGVFRKKKDRCIEEIKLSSDSLSPSLLSRNSKESFLEVILEKINSERELDITRDAYHGLSLAQIKLGLITELDKHDYLRAFEWYSEAAQRGFKPSYIMLILLCSKYYNNNEDLFLFIHKILNHTSISDARILTLLVDELISNKASWLSRGYNHAIEQGKLFIKEASALGLNSFCTYSQITSSLLIQESIVNSPLSIKTRNLYYSIELLKHYYSFLSSSTLPSAVKYGVFLECCDAGNLGNHLALYLVGNIFIEANQLIKDYPQYLKIYEYLASNNDMSAQFSLAKIYAYSGDMIKAVNYYHSAASQGYPEAQFELGNLLFNGATEVQKDVNAALEWYTKSAAQGYPRALYTLGLMYSKGLEIAQNLSKSIQYYTYAAKEGFDEARNALIGMWREGNKEAAISLGRLYADVSVERAPDTTDQDVFSWLSAAASEGDMKALYRLGRMYEYGWGTLKNEQKAFECFMKGARDYRYGPAQKAVAEMYQERGGRDERFLAVKWYSRAAKQGDAGASAAIKDIADNTVNASALYALGRAHEEGWGIARDEDEALLQYEQSAFQGYFKGQYKVAVKQLEGKAPIKEELAPLELLTLLSGEEARRNYLCLMGKKFDRKERKKLRKLQQEGSPEERFPEGGYYRAQHKLAELYEMGQGVPFKKIEDQIEACREAIRLYEKAGEAIQRGKLVTLEPLGRARTTLSHLQQLNDQEKFDLDHPGFKEFLDVYGLPEDKKLDQDFRNQLALVFDTGKSFDKPIRHEIKKNLRKILTFPTNSKPAWGLLTMLRTLIRDSESSKDSKTLAQLQEELGIISRKIDAINPLWCLIPSAIDVESKLLKICKWMIYDPRVEVFNSCYREFEKTSYEDSFKGSVEKILTIFDKLHLPGLAGEIPSSAQDLSQTRQHLRQLLTHDNKADHRFKNRLVKIADIVQEKFEEGKLTRDNDLLTSLKSKLYIWAERGGGSHRDCLTGGEDELSQFYFNYIIDSKGGNASALAKEDWTLEMQVAVWLANLRKQLINELVIEKDENRIHAVKHLEKKARVALGLLGDAEKYVDGLESTIAPNYLSMTPENIFQAAMQRYTSERIVEYITSQVNKLEKRDEISKSPFYEKLWRRLQFQYIREEVAPQGELDYSLFQDEEWLLSHCTQEKFEQRLYISQTSFGKDEQVKKIPDWETIKRRAYMRARERMDQDFYDDHYQFKPQAAKAILNGMRYLEEEK